MRFFPILDFQYEILAVFLGLVSALLIYLALRSGLYSREKKDVKGNGEDEYFESIGVGIKNHPVPPFLIFLFVGYVVFLFLYVFFIGVQGRPF